MFFSGDSYPIGDENRKFQRLHRVTGTIVLSVAYLLVLALVGQWVR
jgi:hypothetical protein